MSRYRPPQPKSSAYITSDGAQTLRDELQQLWKVERPQVTAAVHEAAKNGDRSENGDYIYGKRRLREIDRRVRYLSKRLDEVTVVDRPPANQHKVYFGAWVTVEDEQAQQREYRLVGPDEFDLGKGWLSVDSPLARALLGKSLEDAVIFKSPNGVQELFVVSIRYTP